MNTPETLTTSAISQASKEQTGNLLPRVGQISFINCLPVVLPLQHGLIAMPAEMHFAAPSVLNGMFSQNQLDLGAMSSFYFLSRAEKLKLLPDISIACSGAVGSVLLFSKCRFAELRSKIVLGSAQSATSLNLLKVLLQKHFKFVPEIITDNQPDLDREDVTAALVIGDRALAVDANWSAKYYRMDLGQWWFDTYGLPMVFGVWAAYRSWADMHRQDFERIAVAHLQSRDLGLHSYFPEIIDEAVKRTALAPARLSSYYRQELDFRLNADHWRSLKLYRQLCVELGLLEPMPEAMAI